MFIILLILLLCSPAMHAGGCVSPIPGENLWRLTARIGSCLDTLSCAFGNIIPLTQANLSGGMTITTPGHYKLCEDVTAPSTAVVEINSDGVVFDLGGFTLTNMDIYIGDGVAVKDVVVQNGVMTGAPRFIDIFPSGSQNIVLQNLTLDTVTNTGTPNFAIRALTAAGNPLTGLMLNNITIYNGAPNNIVVAGISGSLISDVVIDNVQMIGTNSALAVTPGVDNSLYIFESNNVFINNVSIENPAAGINGVWVNSSRDVFVTNTAVTSTNAPMGTPNGFVVMNSSMIAFDSCVCDGEAFNNGIALTNNFANCVFDSCRINGTSSSGFVVDIGAIIDNCLVTGTGGDGFQLGASIVTNSSAINNVDNGFSLISGNNVLTNTVAFQNFNSGYAVTSQYNQFINATADTNTVNGFMFSTVSSANNNLINCQAIRSVGGQGYLMTDTGVNTFESCTSVNSVDNGFSVGSANNIFESCTSANNGGDGFSVTGGDNIFESCTSVNNTGDGFNVINNGNSFISCASNNNSLDGFYVSVMDGCLISDSTMNENANLGVRIENIFAEALYLSNAQQNNTLNIGQELQTGPTTNPINSRGVRLVNNTALKNGDPDESTLQLAMSGTLFDTGLVPVGPAPFGPITIVPPIGVVNAIQGSVVLPASPYAPIPGTILGPQVTTQVAAVVGIMGNVVGGNVIDTVTVGQ